MDSMVFVFFSGCLFMALLYHFVLSIIQKNKLVLIYSSYLLVATLFLIERVFIGYIFIDEDPLVDYWFQVLDETIQMLLFFTYVRFVAHAVNLFNIPVKKYITYYYILLGILALYIIFHLLGISLGLFQKRTPIAYIGIRIFLIVSLSYMLVVISKYRYNYFFNFIIIGSLIMLTSGVLAFISSITNKPILGIYGVMWSCIGLVLDVACFSAALGYKARKDFEQKLEANRHILVQQKQLQQKEIENMNAFYLARDAERIRIASDLHDDIGASLSSIHIYSQVAEASMNTNMDKAKSIVKKININARKVLEDMSDIVWAMQQHPMDDKSFMNRIKNYGQELLAEKNIKCTYPKTEDLNICMHQMETRKNILMIIKEAMNNIAKYSQASESCIKLYRAADSLHLKIIDNGKGFDYAHAAAGNGLRNMKLRTEQLSGKFECISGTNNGTEIHCSFPITSFSDIPIQNK